MHTFNTKILKPTFSKIGIIGLGLIGGSLARVFKTKAQIPCIAAADIDSGAGLRALQSGEIDVFIDLNNEPLDMLSGCDLLMLCVSPSAACEIMPKLNSLNAGMISDTCSVKVPVMKAAAGLTNFIGGHPMAGAETSGYNHGRADLFEGAGYVVCVPDNCMLNDTVIKSFSRLIESIGAFPVKMSAEKHDERVAVISHLPHVAAYALSAVAGSKNDETLASLAGRGFCDTTRVAGSSPELWTDILMASDDNIISSITEYIACLSNLKDSLQKKDTKSVKGMLNNGLNFNKKVTGKICR